MRELAQLSRLRSHIHIEGGTRKYGRCAGFHRIEIVVESVWFRRLIVRLQVIGPAVSNRLVPQFRFDGERSCRGPKRREIADAMTSAREGPVIQRLADDRDVGVCSVLVKTVR